MKTHQERLTEVKHQEFIQIRRSAVLEIITQMQALKQPKPLTLGQMNYNARQIVAGISGLLCYSELAVSEQLAALIGLTPVETVLPSEQETFTNEGREYVFLSKELQPLALDPDQCEKYLQPKRCKDCAYFTEPFKSRPRCSHPLVPKEDLVYGDNRRCEDARKNFLKNSCGWEAIFFTAKPNIPSNTPS